MRPRTIACFEWLYLWSLAALAIRSAYGWPDMVDYLGTGISVVVLAIYLLLPTLLVLLVSRRRSNVAQWLLLPCLLLHLSVFRPYLLYGVVPDVGLEQMVVLAMQVTAFFLLFTPSALAWLAGKGAPLSGATPEETFD